MWEDDWETGPMERGLKQDDSLFFVNNKVLYFHTLQIMHLPMAFPPLFSLTIPKQQQQQQQQIMQLHPRCALNWRTGNWRTGKWRTGKWRTGKWRTGNWRMLIVNVAHYIAGSTLWWCHDDYIQASFPSYNQLIAYLTVIPMVIFLMLNFLGLFSTAYLLLPLQQ